LKRLRRFIFTISVILFACHLFGQNVDFTTSIDAEEVLEGNYFQISFTLKNARGSSFTPPSFKDFTVMGGPNSSSQMSIVNGRTTQSMAYSYTLMPKKPGSYTIGSASIKVGSKTLKSNEVTVKILRNNQKKNESEGIGEEIFVELELSDSIAYVGQQVLLKYIIYTSIDVRSYNFISESEYDGFYVEELQNFREKAVKVVRGNKQYLKQTLKAVSLFPQQTGKADIGPALLNLGIAIKSERPSFFFSTSMRSKRMSTPSKSINILPAPKGAPLSFSGAIGDYKMTCNIDKNSVSVDGAITVTMNIEGDGDARFVGPPKQKLEGFEIYDPNLLNENSRSVNGKIRSSKTYEYLLVPEERGVYPLIPEFSYYNIDSNKYITIYGPRYKIRVAGGTKNQVVSTEDINARIAPIATTTYLYKMGDPIFSPLHIGVLSLCGLAFILLSAIKVRNNKLAKTDPQILRSRKAQKIAIQKLATSKSFLDNQEIRKFYSSLSENLFSYISDKLHIPVAQISKDNIQSLFSKNDLSKEMASTLSKMIERSEMAIYAGFTPEKANEDYETSKKLIVEIEDALKV